jgi:hypothetical protein
MRNLLAGTLAALAVGVLVGYPLLAHIERDPTFPDPAVDAGILPAAGGKFIAKRPLRTPGENLRLFTKAARRLVHPGIGTRQRARLVMRFSRLSVAQRKPALKRVRGLAARRGAPGPGRIGLTDPKLTAEETVVACRPDSMKRFAESLRETRLSDDRRRNRAAKRRLQRLNRAYRKLCRFDEIQDAVNAADNGDTVVIMPGFYTEPTARKAPHNDPACKDYVEQGTRSSPAPSYEYHYKCPNDINLITILGRDLETDACIRCNVQVHGSGARPEDVLVDAAKEPVDPGVTDDLFAEGKRAPEGAKEVGFRFERTDGAYLGNVTVRHVEEHGYYSIEVDGMTFDRVQAYFAHEYGHLSFATDHLLIQDGDFAGAGDAGIYPGASPPSRARTNSIIRRNDSHHNALGLSGSMGSSLRIVNNDFHDNSTGITLDSISRAGHPGFPQNSTIMRRNRIYSNNFDTYSDENSWVRSSIQAPIGAGIVIGGGNDNVIDGNWIWDNHRWGTTILTVPNAVTEQDSPDDAEFSTSHRNRNTANHMGVSPTGEALPNGTDFWWDELGESNCWVENIPAPGKSITSDPSSLPDCDQSPNIGRGNPAKEAMLANCALLAERETNSTCDWFQPPPKPEG